MNNVTISYLEMTESEQLRAKSCDDPLFTVIETRVKQWRLNHFFYSWVGAEWRWQDKLAWSDEQWQRYAESDNARTFIAYYDGSPAGYFELKTTYKEGGHEVEIAILGITPAFIGKGLGSVLCSQALQVAWQGSPKRVWLETCTQDHPAALPNYKARGMRVYKTKQRRKKS